jgi:hypothetical protein
LCDRGVDDLSRNRFVGDKQITAQAAPLEELHRGALGGTADGFYVADYTACPATITLYTLDPLGDIDVHRFENGGHRWIDRATLVGT